MGAHQTAEKPVAGLMAVGIDDHFHRKTAAILTWDQ